MFAAIADAGSASEHAAKIVERVRAALGPEIQEFLGWLPGQTTDPAIKYRLIVREAAAHGRVGWSCPAMMR